MAVSFAQSPVWGVNGYEASLSFAAAPANGSRVVVVCLSSTAITPDTVTDSNSVALTSQQVVSSANACITLWDYTVSGSPTSTYSFSLNNTGNNWYGIYNLAGVTGGSEFAQNTTGSSGTTLTATIADVTSGDGLLAFGWNNSGTGTGLAISNGSNTVDVTTANVLYGTHSLASSTVSTTATLSQTAGAELAILIARYYATSSSHPFESNMSGNFMELAGGFR